MMVEASWKRVEGAVAWEEVEEEEEVLGMAGLVEAFWATWRFGHFDTM